MIKRVGRYILSFVLYYSGIIVLLRLIERNKGQLKVLVYHRVNNNLEGSSAALSIVRFRKHMNYLKRNYKVISLSEAVTLAKDSKKFPAGTIAVTFDDGHKDNFYNVFPLIKQLNIPITIFLASGIIGQNKMLWPDQLYYFLKEQDRLAEFTKIREKLKLISDEERIKALASMMPNKQRDLMLNWDEVRQLSCDQRVEIGAHTKTHPVLTNTDNKVAQEEVLGSKNEIESASGKKIKGFSYPAGRFNAEIKKIVKESCFDYACTVDGRSNTELVDLFALSRINIDNCPLFVFAAELCGIIGFLRRLI